MGRLFHLELKNCLHRKEFKLIFLTMMLISIGSFLFSCFYKWGGNQYGGSLLHVRSAYEMSIIQVSGGSIISALCFLLPLFAALIYSDTYYSDSQSGVYKSILTRTDPKVFLWAKTLVISVVTFFTFFIPLIINQLLCLIAFPIQGFDNNQGLPPYDIGIQNYSSEWMFDLVRLQSPFLYNLIYTTLISLAATIFALFAYAAYFVVKKGKFAVISGVFLLYTVSQVGVFFVSHRLALVNLLIPNTGSVYVLILWLALLLIPSILMIAIKSRNLEAGIEG